MFSLYSWLLQYASPFRSPCIALHFHVLAICMPIIWRPWCQLIVPLNAYVPKRECTQGTVAPVTWLPIISAFRLCHILPLSMCAMVTFDTRQSIPYRSSIVLLATGNGRLQRHMPLPRRLCRTLIWTRQSRLTDQLSWAIGAVWNRLQR